MRLLPDEPSRSVPGAPSSAVAWRRREAELAARVAELHESTAEIVARPEVLPDLHPDRPWRAPAVVDGLLRICIEALRSADEPAALRVHALSMLISDLQRTASELAAHAFHLRARRLEQCEEGLVRLQALPSSGDLVDQACETLVRQCGFGRAVLSRVEGSTWMPWTAYCATERGTPTSFDDWRDRAIAFTAESLEAQVARERRPAVSRRSRTASVLGPAAIDGGTASSHAVAPIVHDGRVVGLLHADYAQPDRSVDETDRDILWRYAEGFAQIYERTILSERLADQRDRVREALATTKRMMDELRDASIDLHVGAPGGASSSPSAPPPGAPPVGAAPVAAAALGSLTTRERDVLELMLVGAGNRAIAERLTIAPGTVKFHVQNILRKLGASNRAQAIATCLQLQQIGRAE